MYHIEATLEGLAPILFNRVTDLEALDADKKKGRMSSEDRDTEALQKVYADEHGLYLPARNLKKCILEGVAKAGIKVGRASAMPYIKATVFGTTDRFHFNRESPDGVHITTGRRPPKTGGMVIIKRPFLDTGWVLPVSLVVVDDRRDARQIQIALEEAGLLCGLCDERPEYGRFRVARFERV